MFERDYTETQLRERIKVLEAEVERLKKVESEGLSLTMEVNHNFSKLKLRFAEMQAENERLRLSEARLREVLERVEHDACCTRNPKDPNSKPHPLCRVCQALSSEGPKGIPLERLWKLNDAVKWYRRVNEQVMLSPPSREEREREAYQNMMRCVIEDEAGCEKSVEPNRGYGEDEHEW